MEPDHTRCCPLGYGMVGTTTRSENEIQTMDCKGQGQFLDIGRTIRLRCSLGIQVGEEEARRSTATATAKSSERITKGRR